MKRAPLCTLFALLAWTAAAPAAIPQTINYQGVLREAGGTIVADGDYDLTFSLYAAASGGTALWTESQTLAVVDGTFNANLGSVTPLALDFTIPYWLGITVEGDAELTPRLELAAAPYSLNAERLDGLSSGDFASTAHAHALDSLSDVSVPDPADGQVLSFSAGEWVASSLSGTDDGDWVIAGDDIYRMAGKVGVGQALPKQAPAKSKDGRLPRDASDAKLNVYTNSGEAPLGLHVYFDDLDNGANTRAAIFGWRDSHMNNPGGNSWPGVWETNNAVTGANIWGDPNSFGVAGYTWFDGPRTGGVLGSDYIGGIWGALGYNDASEVGWGVYTPDNAYVGGTLQLPGGTAVAGSGTAGYLTRWTGAGALGNAVLYDTGTRVGIGTTTPDRPLQVISPSGSALYGRVTYAGPVDHVGVEGYSRTQDNYGIGGRFEGGFMGLYGIVNVTGSGNFYGIRCTATGGTSGMNATRYGVFGEAYGMGFGGTSFGVYGVGSGAATNYGGYFSGNVHVNGTLSKSAGAFKIDHPLDPEHKTLSHSFVESPDMMNVYNGNIVLGSDGAAWVEMPEWFEALNRDFRYQLTAIGAPGPNLYLAQKIAGNRFRIAGGTAGLEVSWQVTGIRQDAYANAHRIPVEELKNAKDQGLYLSPEAFGLPETMGVDYEANHSQREREAQ